ncbi:MAG: hypothetical protein Ct9H90mP16_09290 [Candidatus Poseidoniales archaeon]|nr:MAG: hypothetical protein Ct9H90mP16_09290 [Candidatus Poseidoniales archaeon]
MTASVHWIGTEGLPEHQLLIVAVPPGWGMSENSW